MVLRPVVTAVVAGLALAACGTLQKTGEIMRAQLISPAVSPPDYQPGLEYLPVKTSQGPAWMVRAYADSRAGASDPVLVWYAKPDLMLRTESGRITGVRGFAQTLLRLDAGSCPKVAAYPHLRQPVNCELIRDSATSFGLRQRVRVDPPRLLAAGWEKIPGPLLVVREKPLDGDTPGNFYLFSMAGDPVLSRQWIAPDFWLEMSAIEVADGTAPTLLTAGKTTAAPAEATPAETGAAEPAPAPPVAPPVAEPAVDAAPEATPVPAPVADPVTETATAAATEPAPAPATAAPAPATAPVAPAVQMTPQGRVVPGQPPGFVRKAR